MAALLGAGLAPQREESAGKQIHWIEFGGAKVLVNPAENTARFNELFRDGHMGTTSRLLGRRDAFLNP
jgi:hypothetical protein